MPFRSEPLRLELIRLPVYIVEARFAASEGAASEGAASEGAAPEGAASEGAALEPAGQTAPERKDSVAVHVAVDGLNGSVERLDRSLKLETARRGGARSASGEGDSPEEASRGVVVPANLSAAEALARARSELPWLSLHFALRRGLVYSLVELDVSDRVGYPYWILHTLRRQRRDFRALDGISGKRLGSRGRSLVVQGYILLARQEGSLRPSTPVEES